ncbi:hypothetical protein PIB30_014039 [Stylosanthes scabra]|uniref:Disease resistance protein RPS4B/Roq1-like leucine-rich repeats domain-containing protein n=1 Tax=Stylosanthes scabra TaxID=79078 RepID=A0ABU6Z664_9FABA|nr:hypothetical protein [Stylosanthes scabra]
MHDLLEEMGRHIVIQESPNDPSKRSRLRYYEDIDLVLTQKKGTEATHSIIYPRTFDKMHSDVRWKGLTFSNISQLKILILDGLNVPVVSYIPCSLRVFHWESCPMETLPFIDQYYELVEIDLQNSSSIVQVWHGQKFLEKLKYLRLHNCSRLKQIPDLSKAPNLEILYVQGCGELEYFPSHLTSHKGLVELKLIHCPSLETLGSKLKMSSLKKLDISGCISMRKLPEFGKCMKNLSILSLWGIAIEELPMTVGRLVGLSNLNIYDCRELHCLPSSIGCLVSLNQLHLGKCKSLTCLPHSIQELKSLMILNISNCPNLLKPWHPLSGLTSLVTLKLAACFLTSHESLSYNLGHLASLTDLDLSENNFVRVPINIHKLSKLRCLNLENCLHLKVLPELPSSIRELNARNCISLDLWNSNVISKTCCGFVESANHDRNEFLQMWLTEKQIRLTTEFPWWFVHQERGNGVSVTLPHHETLSLALCFQFCPMRGTGTFVFNPLVICNGKEFIKKSLTTEMREIKYTQYFILCLTSDYFVDQFCQDYRFELVLPYYVPIKVQSCGARWVCKQDIQDFKKQKAERKLERERQLLI